MSTIKKITEAQIDPSTEVGLEVKTEETKYMLMTCQKNAEKILT